MSKSSIFEQSTYMDDHMNKFCFYPSSPPIFKAQKKIVSQTKRQTKELKS